MLLRRVPPPISPTVTPFHLCGIGVYNAYFATVKGLQKTNSMKCVRILDVRVWTLSTTNHDLQ